jgi:predicted transcriptional regulator
MQRPSAPGVPFYFIKTDISGNVLKRSSATRFQFTQFGGTCPLWNVYRTFGRPGEISVQVARTPDDVTYLNIACTVGRSGGHFMSRPRNVAVVLGCEISYAPKLVYAAGLDLERLETADPIGPGCRACSRTECRHRAMPAVGQALDIATSERGVLPYRVRDLP